MMTFVKKKKYSDRKTEEEILTLRQVLTAKERHAAGKIDFEIDPLAIISQEVCKT